TGLTHPFPAAAGGKSDESDGGESVESGSEFHRLGSGHGHFTGRRWVCGDRRHPLTRRGKAMVARLTRFSVSLFRDHGECQDGGPNRWGPLRGAFPATALHGNQRWY